MTASIVAGVSSSLVAGVVLEAVKIAHRLARRCSSTGRHAACEVRRHRHH